jgi:hypothetical protein
MRRDLVTRRGLMAGAAAGALLAVARADASGLFLISPPVAPGFNGGRSQVNFNFVQFGGEYPFINHLLTAQNWGFVSVVGTQQSPGPNDLDANGYPITSGVAFTNGGVSTVIYLPLSVELTGVGMSTQWYVKYTGSGTIVIRFGSNTISGAGGTYGPYAHPNANGNGGTTVSITANPNNDLNNLQIYNASDATALAAGEVFGTQFKSVLKTGNFGAYRFLNWLGPSGKGVNFTNMRYWKDRKPQGYWSYVADEARAAYVTTSANQSTSHSFATSTALGYSCSAPSDWGVRTTPNDKDIVIAMLNVSARVVGNPLSSGVSVSGSLMTVTSTTSTTPIFIGAFVTAGNGYTATITNQTDNAGNPIAWTGAVSGPAYYSLNNSTLSGLGIVGISNPVTLAVGTQSPAPVKSYQGLCPGSGAPFAGSWIDYSVQLVGGRFATFVWDAHIASWIKFGGDISAFDMYLANGVPPEVCFQLCKEMGAHPWFNVPFLSCDPITDWCSGLATYLQANAPSWMIPRYEVTPNETWNTIFPATTYAWLKAYAHWTTNAGATNQDDWVGQVASTGGQAINAVYGSVNPAKAQVICGYQTAGGGPSHTARITSSLYVSQSSGQPAYNYLTHTCVANYIGPANGPYSDGSANAATAANNWLTHLKANDITAAGTTMSAYVTSNHVFGTFAANAASVQSSAAAHGVNKITYYEGGWSPGDYGTISSNQQWFEEASKLYGSSMQDTMCFAYSVAMSVTGAEFPSQYLLGEGAFGSRAVMSGTNTISGNVLTIGGISTGTISIGGVVNGSDVAFGTVIQQQLTGSAGSTGTYWVNISQTSSNVTVVSNPTAALCWSIQCPDIYAASANGGSPILAAIAAFNTTNPAC